MRLFRKTRETEKKEPDLTRTEALAGIPEKSNSATWEMLANGEILIEYPLNIKPFFLQLTSRLHRGRQQRLTKKLQLDKMGSNVWQMIDARKNVKTIIVQVAEQTGLSRQEAEISVTTFLRELGRRGLILIR